MKAFCMGRRKITRELSLWPEERSSGLPRGKAESKPRWSPKGRVERDERLEAELDGLTVAQGLERWRALGVVFRLSGACIEAHGLTTEVPFPGSVSRWVHKNGSEIRLIVNA
jgi:hypothetical protein